MSTPRVSSRAQPTAEQPINYFIQQAVENPIILDAELVDESSFPTAEIADAPGRYP